jgi:hypothetical protein
MLMQKVAALQAWFAQDKEFDDTCRRSLALAKDTKNVLVGERVARICSLRESDDRRHEAALVVARRAVEFEKENASPWVQKSLGVAEYRVGHFVAADAALAAAIDLAKDVPRAAVPSAFYRAMSLFRQGKHDQARVLAVATAARMKPLPADEQNPPASAVAPQHRDLIMWLAYKEAKALIHFDAAPVAKASRDAK